MVPRTETSTAGEHQTKSGALDAEETAFPPRDGSLGLNALEDHHLWQEREEKLKKNPKAGR